MDDPMTSASRPHGWARGLRPLLWWLALVLGLYGLRTHQRLSENTRLIFSVTLAGRSIPGEATAKVDKRGFTSGEKISIGWHALTVSHPKGEAFTTNLFVWYGPHDLGTLELPRATGRLELHSNPPAKLLEIRGVEFSQKLTNSDELTLTVPTDSHEVEATYRHGRERQRLLIRAGATTSWRFAPRLGAVTLTCNQSDATYELADADGRLLDMGALPVTLGELPAARYQLRTQHHRHRRELAVTIQAGATNELAIDWNYGAARLESEPAGAVVTTTDGVNWGFTPLTLAELPVGRWEALLRREGYEPVAFALEITAHQTNTLHTNLVSRNFTGALEAAQRYFAAEDYERAAQAASDALLAKRDDPAAQKLQREATLRAGLRRAEAFKQQGQFVAGAKELEKVLAVQPDHAEATQLLTELKAKAAEQLEQKQRERSAQIQRALDTTLAKFRDANLFEAHEIKTGKSFSEVRVALLRAMSGERPLFAVTRQGDAPETETYAVEAKQELPDGLRQIVIVAGQSAAAETVVRFKVLEYKGKHRLSVAGLLNFTDNIELLALHSSRIPDFNDKLKARVEEGVRLVTERLQRALGTNANEK